MKKLFLLVFIGWLSLSGKAQQVETTAISAVNSHPATDPKPVDESLVLREEVYDFGKIPQGKPVHHVFIVTNKGKEPLKIANVQASCGCTTPEWDKDTEIPAGQDSKITVGYNAAAEGAFTKFITVTYNETATKQITIKGEVWKTPAASAPENKSLNDLKNK